MSEQATWVPLPKKRVQKVRAADALARCERLVNWYEAYKPEVERLLVTQGDYQALEEAAGTHGIAIDSQGLRYRIFRVVVSK